MTPLDHASIYIRIPGRFIKQGEHQTTGHPYDKVIRNREPVAAITEYFRDFRPIFDGGRLLFPSFHASTQGSRRNRSGRSLTMSRFENLA